MISDAASYLGGIRQSVEAGVDVAPLPSLALLVPDQTSKAVSVFAVVNGGGALVVLPDASTNDRLQATLEQAARYSFPTVHAFSNQVRRGGLMVYSSNVEEKFRAGASYVDRLFRGASIESLPAPAADSFEPVLNLKTAAAFGLTFPHALGLSPMS